MPRDTRTHRSPARRRARRHAFTLLEVLAAMFMVVLLMLAAYQSVRAAFDIRESAERTVSTGEAITAALDRLATDLEVAPAPNGVLVNLFSGESEIGYGGEPADMLTFRTMSGRVELTGQGEQGSLVRGGLGDTGNQQVLASDLQEVSYQLIPDLTGERSDLVRLVTRNLLAEQTPEPEVQTLLRGVIALDFLYDDGSQYLEEWDSTQQGDAVPHAVRVVLTVEPGYEPRGLTESRYTLDRNNRTSTHVRLMRLPASATAEEQDTVQRR